MRPLRIAFSVPLNICKGIHFMNTICKCAFFNDQRCSFPGGPNSFGTSGENNENVLVKICKGIDS